MTIKSSWLTMVPLSATFTYFLSILFILFIVILFIERGVLKSLTIIIDHLFLLSVSCFCFMSMIRCINT